MASISRGVADVANRFMPGSGAVVRGVSRLLGFGAYTREKAEQYLASKVPAMHATLDKGIRVAHHEYLGEMSSSTAFTIASYAINPGVATTFPWLSSVAAAFQKWEDNGICFYFKSTSASALNSTNTALGSMIGAVTYNPYQLAPLDKIAMLGLSGSAAGKPAEDNIFPVECKASQSLFSTKLVRTNAVADDLAKYDSGNFHIASVGAQATATVGELHIVYDITLKEPKLAPIGWVGIYYLSGAVTGAAPLGAAAPTTPVNLKDPFASTFDLANRKMLFGIGALSKGVTYRGTYYVKGTAANLTTPIVTLTNAQFKNGPFAIADSMGYAPSNGANSDSYMLSFTFTVNDPMAVASINFDAAGVLPTNPTKATLSVEELGNL